MNYRRNDLGLPMAPPDGPESEKDRAHRLGQTRFDAEVKLSRLFGFLRATFGDEEARAMFEVFVKERKGKSSWPRKHSYDWGPSKGQTLIFASSAERDNKLVEYFESSGWAVKTFSEIVNERYPGAFGSSAIAIEKHLHRLRSDRRDQRTGDRE